MLRFIRIAEFGAAVAAAVLLAGLSTQSQAQTGTVHLRIIKAVSSSAPAAAAAP